MNILIAEDESFLAQIYESFFLEAGYDVQIAADGQEALDTIEEHTPDLIVLDLLMPNVSGFDVLEKRKSDPVLGVIPVIVLTGLEEQGVVDDVLAMGANDYFDKNNVELEPLLEKVKQILK